MLYFEHPVNEIKNKNSYKKKHQQLLFERFIVPTHQCIILLFDQYFYLITQQQNDYNTNTFIINSGGFLCSWAV